MKINYWKTGVSGDWSSASNWSTNKVPASGDIDIDNNGAITATNTTINHQVILLDPSTNATVSLALDNSTLGSSSLFVFDTDVRGAAVVNVDLTGTSDLNGLIFDGSGPATETVRGTTVNHGLIGTVGSNANDTIIDRGTFTNAGVLVAGEHGSANIDFGFDPNSYSTVENSGVIQADPGGSLYLNADGANLSYFGTVHNDGRINADGGTVDIRSDLTQSATGVVNVTNGGDVIVTGSTDGGTIAIESGMLTFGGDPVPTPIGLRGALEFGSTIDFKGLSATLSFGNAIGIGETYDATTDRLFVTAPFEGMQDTGLIIHLVGAHSADQFSVQGSSIVYTAHPTS